MSTIYWTLDTNPEDYEPLRWVAISHFLRGECYAFAIALNQGLGWPLMGLKAGDTIWHAGVRSPDNRIHDVRGILTEEEFKEEFQADFFSLPLSIREISEEELRAARPISEHSVNTARELAELLWPDLPWIESRAVNVQAFADELEALSRKHNLWICGGTPVNIPLLLVGDGDEYGYLVRTTAAGKHTISRVFPFEAEREKEHLGQD